MVNVALVGVCGYGAVHARRFLELHAAGDVRVVAFVEPVPERDPLTVERLLEAGARHYRQIADLLEPVDACVVAAPIHFHRPLCMAALERGWHVLLEKPAAATVQDLAAMVAAQQRAGRIVAVNFQHAARPGFRALLAQVGAGRLGRVRRVTGWGVWCRDDQYYSRTRWAGRLAVDGQWVLDGTVMNPFAHLVNNALIAASPVVGRPAAVAAVTAELYHANPIESEDTSCVRVWTADGVEVLLFLTLAGPEGQMLGLRVEGAAGAATWDYEDQVAYGAAPPTGSPGGAAPPTGTPEGARSGVVDNFLAAVRGEAVSLYTPLDAALAHVQVANGAFLSSWPPAAVPAKQVPTVRGSLAWRIPGIAELIAQAVAEGRLFSELGAPWARAGRRIDLSRLTEFAPPAGK